MISVGMDVSKDKINVCIDANFKNPKKAKQLEFILKNNESDFPEFLKKLKKAGINEDVQVAMEPTGIYHMPIATWLYEHGFKVVMVNPFNMKHFALSEGFVSKNDKLDAQKLLSYVEKHELLPWAPKNKEIKELCCILTRINQLVAMRTEEKNRIGNSEFGLELQKRMDNDIRPMINFINSEIKRLKADIEIILKSHPALLAERKRLANIPGIGKTTALALVILFNEREYPNARHVVSFVGLVPKENESGTHRGETPITKKGPAQIRAYLYMAAQAAARSNPLFKEKYQKQCLLGKNKRSQLCIIMRKLLVVSYSVWRNQTVFDCDYEKKRRAAFMLKRAV